MTQESSILLLSTVTASNPSDRSHRVICFGSH